MNWTRILTLLAGLALLTSLPVGSEEALTGQSGVKVLPDASIINPCQTGRVVVGATTGAKYRCISAVWVKEEIPRCSLLIADPPSGACSGTDMCLSKTDGTIYICNESNVWEAYTTGGGGSGSPGGSTTQVQFNLLGAFAGDPQLTWNSGSDTLTALNVSSSTGSFQNLTASSLFRLPQDTGSGGHTSGDMRWYADIPYIYLGGAWRRIFNTIDEPVVMDDICLDDDEDGSACAVETDSSAKKITVQGSSSDSMQYKGSSFIYTKSGQTATVGFSNPPTGTRVLDFPDASGTIAVNGQAQNRVLLSGANYAISGDADLTFSGASNILSVGNVTDGAQILFGDTYLWRASDGELNIRHDGTNNSGLSIWAPLGDSDEAGINLSTDYDGTYSSYCHGMDIVSEDYDSSGWFGTDYEGIVMQRRCGRSKFDFEIRDWDGTSEAKRFKLDGNAALTIGAFNLDFTMDGTTEVAFGRGYIDMDFNADGTSEHRILGDYDGDGSFEFVDDICTGIQNFCDPDADDTQENRGTVDLNGDNTADPYCGTVSILPGIYNTVSGERTCTIDYGGLTVRGLGEGPTINASDLACSELDGGNNMTIFWFTDNSTDGTFSNLGLTVENINLEGPGSREENDSSCDMNGTPSGHCTGNWCPERTGYGTRVIGMVVQGYRQVRLENNTILDMDAQGMGVENCEDVTMIGNHVKHAGEHCFLSTRTDGLVFANNTGETCGLSTAGDCFYWSNRDYMSPKNNSFTGNVCTNSQIGFRFETFAGGVGAYSATITGNIFEGPGHTSTIGTPSAGLNFVMESGSSMKDVVIANNVIAKFPNGCFWLNPATASDLRSFLIEGNTFSDCSSTSTEVLLEGDDITFRGNTIVDVDGDGTVTGYGLWMRGGDRLTVENNDIRGLSSQGIRLDSSQSTTSNARILNNHFVVNKTSSQNTGVYIAAGVTGTEVSGNDVGVESIDYTGDGTVDTATIAQGITSLSPAIIRGNVINGTATAGIGLEGAGSAGSRVIGNVVIASAGYCIRALNAGAGITYLANYCTGSNQNDAPFEENGATNGFWFGNVYSGIYGSTAPVSYQTGSGGETAITDFNRDGTLNDPVLLQGGTLVKVIEQNLVTPKYRSSGTTIAAAGPWYSSAGCGSSECWVFDFDGDGTIEAGDFCVLPGGQDDDCDGTTNDVPDAHTGLLIFSDATASTHDTGALVCAIVDRTCVDTYTPAGDTTGDCTTDYNTGSATPFYAICR